MKRNIWLGAALCLLMHSLSMACCAAAPSVSARSAIVTDRTTGTVFYEKEPDRQSLIASTTKIMTGLLVCETCDLAQTVTVPENACGIEGSSLYLKPGDKCTVEELLYGMMLHSGNDAATTLAIVVSGNEAAFVRLMNRRAAELGLENTRFDNPHGLDSGENYSTARDLARLACAALEHPVFAQVVSTEQICVNGRTLTNHNKLLRLYDGADGVKTGYTKAAGRILVSSATRKGRQLVAVTLHAPDDWQDHRAMLDHAFGQFTCTTVVEKAAVLGTLPAVGAADTYALLQAEDSVEIGLLPGEQPHIRLLTPGFLYGPVTDGQRVGTAQVMLKGKILGSCDLIAVLP